MNKLVLRIASRMQKRDNQISPPNQTSHERGACQRKTHHKEGVSLFSFSSLTLLFLIFLSCVLLSEDACAARIGIAPAYISIDYEPTAEREYEVRIYNTEGSGLKAEVSISGDLAQYITLNQSSVEIMPGEIVKPFSFKIRFPANLSPGNYKADISATALSEARGTVATAAVVSMQVFMYVLSEKYLKTQLEVTGDIKKEFIITLENIGQKDIERADAVLRIFEKSILIDNIVFDDVSIRAGTSETLRRTYTNKPGEYLAKLSVNYDGEEKLLARDFKIDKKSIKIGNIEMPDFEFGKINRILVYAESNWNRNITVNPKIEISKRDLQKRVTASIRANPFEMEKQAAIEFFWDCTDVPEGVYDARVLLEYDGSVSEKQFIISVEQKRVAVEAREGNVFKKIVRTILLLSAIAAAVVVFLIIIRAVVSGVVSKTTVAKMSFLMNKAAWLAERSHLESAAECYAKIRKLYARLDEKQKEEFYEKLIRLYNFIKRERERGGRRLSIK